MNKNWSNSAFPMGLGHAQRWPRGIKQEFEKVRSRVECFQTEFLNSHLKFSEGNYEQNPNELDHVLLQELNRRGFFSMWLPKILGGEGFHPLSMNIFNEMMGAQCLGVANIVGAHYFGFGLLGVSHNYKIMRRITQEIRAGEITGQPCLLSAAVTEPTAGTDREDLRLLRHAQLSCWAERDSNGYRVYGSKKFISNAAWARYHILITTLEKNHPERETLILVVPQGAQGLKVLNPLRKWGQNACPASEMQFESCLISDENVALDSSQFSTEAEYSTYSSLVTDNLLAQSRAGVASLAAGVCLGILTKLEKQVALSKEKNSEWQQSKFSDIIKNAYLSRLIAWEASLAAQIAGPQKTLLNPIVFQLFKFIPRSVAQGLGRLMESKSFSQKMRKKVLDYGANKSLSLSSLAKFSASDMAHDSVVMALEIIGLNDPDSIHLTFMKALRDCKLLQIYEGTNQLNRIQSFHAFHEGESIELFNESPESLKSQFSSRPELNQEKIQILRSCFDCCFRYSQNRNQGGKKIINWTEHRRLIGKLKLEVEAFEKAYSSCTVDQERIALSIRLDEQMLPFVSMCMQLMGGQGYLYESGMPDLFQQALRLRLQSSSSERQTLDFMEGMG